MTSFPALRRWVLSACVAAVFGVIFIVLALQNHAAVVAPTGADAGKDEPRPGRSSAAASTATS